MHKHTHEDSHHHGHGHTHGAIDASITTNDWGLCDATIRSLSVRQIDRRVGFIFFEALRRHNLVSVLRLFVIFKQFPAMESFGMVVYNFYL
jgi:hypothetical protein